jgi:maltose/maltodextrin transport system substrate-binding protein
MAYLQFAAAEPDHELAGEARRQAVAYGEWLLANRMPADWRCGGLPYSTITEGGFGGGVEGAAITVFRSARAAEGMVALFDATGEHQYLNYASEIADVLVDLQQDDGSWPYRVDPRDGAVVERYASGVVTPMRLFGLLDQRLPAPRFGAARAAAESWLVAGPISTGLWQGQYEDITEQPMWQNLQHWDTNETIRYLLSDSCRMPDRITLARKLNDYIEDQFVLWCPEDGGPVTVRCPTPSVLEQYRCYHPMEVHTGNWLLSLLALHRATGDDEFLAKGTAAANSIVAGQSPDGSLSTWGFDRRFGTPLWAINWPGCNACAVNALLRWNAYLDTLGTDTDSDAVYDLGLWGL